MAEAACVESAGVDIELGAHEDNKEDQEDRREEEEEDDEEDEESVSSSSLHRIQSESSLSTSNCPAEEEDDSYTRLARSQSDASLLTKKNTSSMEAQDDFPQLMAEADDSSSHNVSECNRVYLDLSRAEPYERVEFTSESTVTIFRASSGRQLETIPQDEELKTVDLSHLYASQRSLNNGGSVHSSLEEVSLGHKNRSSGKSSSSSACSSSSSSSSSHETLVSKGKDVGASFQSCLQAYSWTLKQQVKGLQMGSIPEQVHALQEVLKLLERAWGTPHHGRDLACGLCDLLRTERALDLVVSSLGSHHRPLLLASARLLDQALTTPNRNYLAHCPGLMDSVVKMTRDHQGDVELAVPCTGILESLFKTSERSCGRVIALGGLKVVVHWCRSQDPAILRHCAIALSNLALYGGADNQQEMIDHKAPEWLFPLAFVDDEVTRYYACLTMAALVSNKEIQTSVLQSGTLDLVHPFLRDHDPQQFAQRDPSHAQGRSSDWLRRLAPVLRSSREEARALAAFTMVVEAGIKTEQGKKEVLYEVGAVEHLQWLASNPRSVATGLAAQALAILGEDVPLKLSLQVPLWTVDNVLQWVSQVGFGEYRGGFASCRVDGDLLLRLTESELRDNIGMPCALARKRFGRELTNLKMAADYVSCDPTRVSDWLKQVGSEFTQYAYPMLQAGVDKRTLMTLSETLLTNECAVLNGIHCMKILSKIEEQRVKGSRSGSAQSRASVISCSCDVTGGRGRQQQPIDVFLSYRRSNGSQLASLLKVHLQLRGFSVFIDIERLATGKFDEQLLQSVRQASHLVLVLTEQALDRCVGDDSRKDWVHKEIAEAMEAGVNIIPVMADGFVWPPADSLPSDIRHLPAFNGVRWIHDYQDACVDKLESFLRGGDHPPPTPTPTTTTPPTSSSSPLPPPPHHHHHHTLSSPSSCPSFSSCPPSSSSSSSKSVAHATNCCCERADARNNDEDDVTATTAAAAAAGSDVANADAVDADADHAGDDDDDDDVDGSILHCAGRGGSPSSSTSSTCYTPPSSPSHPPPPMGSSVDAGDSDGFRMNGVLRRSDDYGVNGGAGKTS